jgi:stage II sporulation protein D
MKQKLKSTNRSIWSALTAAFISVSLLFPSFPAHADGGEPTVRVALFIKTNNYLSAAGAATLSAEGGLTLSDKEGLEWFRTADAAAMRASFDGFRVVVAETSDRTVAESFAGDLKKAAQPYAVFTFPMKGRPLYRVEAGPFGSKAQAESVRTGLAGNTAISSRLGGAALKLAGPFHAKASAHATEAEALAAATPLWDAGIYAFPVMTRSDTGTVFYELWVGGAPDGTALMQSIAAAAQAVPGLVLTPVTAGTRYVALRSDVAADSGLAATPTRYAVVGGEGVSLRLTPNQAASPVKVAERYGRSYRGAVDVSVYNGALAVINIVDLETYVASVVGSELDASWPTEVLKAQAVAARTYVLKQGWKYGVANVTDTTFDQAYRGVEREFPVIIDAANLTAGERLVGPSGVLLDAFYHSNAGNRTADPLEVWNNPIPGIVSMPSLDDAAGRNKKIWYRIVLSDQRIGYVRSDLAKLTGAVNAAGFPKASITENGVNIREAPFVNNETNPSIAVLQQGTGITVIDRDIESNSYQWIRGPVSAERLLLQMTSSGIAPGDVSKLSTVRGIEVTKRGAASGRVTEMSINGELLPVSRPEQYRTLFSLPSTRFEVEETASVTVLGAGGKRTALPASTGAVILTAVGAGGIKRSISSDAYLITDGGGTARVATTTPGFRFHGTGFGHGLGMSQWGAYGLAEIGYDYRKILQYYYKEATLMKE